MADGAPALPSFRSSAPAQTLQEAKANRIKGGRYKERGGRTREREGGGREREREEKDEDIGDKESKDENE